MSTGPLGFEACALGFFFPPHPGPPPPPPLVPSSSEEDGPRLSRPEPDESAESPGLEEAGALSSLPEAGSSEEEHAAAQLARAAASAAGSIVRPQSPTSLSICAPKVLADRSSPQWLACMGGQCGGVSSSSS